MYGQLRRYAESLDLLEPLELNLIRPAERQLRHEIGDVSDLMESIRKNGLLQPLVVRPQGDHFEVVAGNRRFEACRKLRWRTVPCIVKELGDREAFEFSIVENVQRDGLSFVEEAEAYRRYTEEFGWGGVSELAQRLGKSPSYISHTMSILNLPKKILLKIQSGELSRSAAQELLWASDQSLQTELAERIVSDRMTVREIRQTIKNIRQTIKNETEQPDPVGWKFVPDKHTREFAILAKSVLALRMAMIRMDSLIEMSDSPDLRRFLMKKRFEIHQMIDDIMAKKRGITSL